MRLLVVEDSPLLRKMFGLAFPQQFHELGQAENGREAIEVLASAPRRRSMRCCSTCGCRT